jgi:formylglycine-generating enzyme required for sulfatase activity
MMTPRSWQALLTGTTLAILVTLTTTFPVSRAGGKKDFPDPTPRKQQILKRFAAEFVSLTPGTGQFPAAFSMGSKDGPAEERPAHMVMLRHSFAIARYEVTQELYHVVMGGNPSKWKGPRNAVEMVTWHEANEFCRKATEELRRLQLLMNEEIRLPTEAEWEYACRAGTSTAYSFGGDVKDLTRYAWYKDNSKGFDPPVGEKQPNPWGLYDMHGYNREWCADDWQPGYEGAPADGSRRTVKGAKERVIRGGAWADPAEELRSAFRFHRPADFRDDKVGFRCVRAAAPALNNKGINNGNPQ